MASGDKFYIADKATLDEVKGKIGNTTDTGGSSSAGTVMAKGNAILSEVGKIGATNDTESSSTTTGSIFAKLNYLVSKMISVYSWCSSMYSWVSSILSKVGSAADTGGAATAGRVMAKLNNVITKNGKICDSNGEFFTFVTSFEKNIMQEVERCETLQNSPNYIKVDNTSIYYVDLIQYKVVKLNKHNFSVEGETPSQAGTINNLILDGSYFYIVDTIAQKIIRFSKTTMSKVAEYDYSGAHTISTQGIAVNSTSLYFWGYIPKKVIKLNKSTLVKTGESQVLDEGIGSCIFSDDSKVYVSIYNSTTGKCSSYRLQQDSLSLEYTFPTSDALTYFYVDDSYIYNKPHATSTVIRKIDRSNNCTVSQLTYSGIGSEIVGDNDYIYVYSGTQVIKVRKDNMTVSAITDASASNIAIDENYLYRTLSTEKLVIKYDKLNFVSKYQITGYVKE